MPTCRLCTSAFEITQDDLAFYDKVSPIFNGKKESIPPPTLCPDCRMQRRLSFRNERNLYHRKCDLTGRSIVSGYSADKPFLAYQSDEWHSDAWDAYQYGRDFDFSRSFFDQFMELKLAVPRIALVTSVQAKEYNCSYINYAGSSRNCYMTFDSDFNEDAYYTKVLKHSKKCVDCAFVHGSELCYDCIDCYDSYNLRSSLNCSNCSDSAFLQNCVGCRNCFFCSNLMQKQYYIHNKPYSKEEYKRIVCELMQARWSVADRMIKEFAQFRLQYPQKFVHQLKVENVSGDYLHNVKDCRMCFEVADGQDLRYCDAVYKGRSCCDVSSFGEEIELIYEGGTIGLNMYHCLFCFQCVSDCSDLLYCDECRSSKNCFGCCGLRHAQYCIFNKQYMKEEYERLVPKIIQHMRKTKEFGEFYPITLSPFGYNETVASEYFPLTKEEALAGGWKWHEAEEPKDQYLGPPHEIPDAIADVPDEITKQILRCSVTGKPYKIIPQELKFYRQMNIPVPRKCPDQRHKERMALRNPRKLWDRTCAKCQRKIATSYSPERPEIVYCEECYLASVY